ncbi:hypothetical protein [Sediminibacterium soli]|uniref:hypothetical protein n=1 Tax=Sediminibacterium soli TaxID=2698829 RepID=UPI001379F76C|nr:hypothetical protein [Sediminibacterium soli]NCI47052.1 hypothetical protein [Sediminibacterium soli]
MKKQSLNIENMMLSELSESETVNRSGGTFPWFVTGAGGLLAFLAKKCIDDWQCFKDGLSGNLCTHGTTHSK